VQWSWDRGCNGHRIPGRVSCRTKALRIIIEASRSREASTGGLGVPAHSPTRAPRPKAEGAVTGSPREGAGGVRVNEGARQGCQRLDRSRRRGKNTPTLMTETARCSAWDSRRRRSAKAGSDAVKTSGPPVMPYGAQDSVGRPRRESGERAGNTRGAGARFSNGWQKSIGRIARLLHREVARPRGDQRALAWRKSVAPNDAGARIERRRNGARVQDL
jgi:hypothetical protein